MFADNKRNEYFTEKKKFGIKSNWRQFFLQVCLSTYDLLLPLGIKGFNIWELKFGKKEKQYKFDF